MINFVSGLIIGVFVGGVAGICLMAMLSANAYNKGYKDCWDYLSQHQEGGAA